jgi:hypothetical protein
METAYQLPKLRPRIDVIGLRDRGPFLYRVRMQPTRVKKSCTNSVLDHRQTFTAEVVKSNRAETGSRFVATNNNLAVPN